MDVASKLVFIRHMPNLTAAFTVEARHALEDLADSVGVKIQEYLTDNNLLRWQNLCKTVPTKDRFIPCLVLEHIIRTV